MLKELPSKVEEYCDPRVTTLLPPLGSPNSAQIDRMRMNNVGAFSCHGGSDFRQLYDAAMSMRTYGCRKYCTSFMGHSVLENLTAGCLGMCPCSSKEKGGIFTRLSGTGKSARIWITFAELISKIDTLDDVYKFCQLIAGKYQIYVLIDQCNALDYMPQSTDRVSESSREILRTTLDKIAEIHFKISSATINYCHGTADRLRISSERVFSINYGLLHVLNGPLIEFNIANLIN